MGRPILALDLDGVVVDLTAEIIRRLVAEGHAAPEWQEPPDFSWKHPSCGLTVKAGLRAHDLFEDPTVYLDADPVAGAIEGVQRLVAAGWMPIAVTHRPGSAANVTHRWLERHGLWDVPVMITGLKAELASRRGFTMAIDDSPSHLEAYDQLGVRCIAYDAPYNQSSPCWKRAAGWSELIGLIG